MYGRDALRRFREQHGNGGSEPANLVDVLAGVPPDAPMDDATLTVWNGNRFVAYETWLATAPIITGETPIAANPDIPADAKCVVADCCGTQISLVRDGDRWRMFAGLRKGRRLGRDFTSHSLAHAISTAEQWYGMPSRGWIPEHRRETLEAQRAITEVLR